LWLMLQKSVFLIRVRLSGRGVRVMGFDVEYGDVPSLYAEYGMIVLDRIYHFDAKTQTPLIIDGGGHIGMSVLYFKSVYPQARVVCFEPDGAAFRILKRNVEENRLDGVELVQAALASDVGVRGFKPDGSDGGRLVDERDSEVKVKTVRLSEYLSNPVDFLKLNIEGMELPVLREAEASGRLRNVREMVLEYHGFAGEGQRLGAILDLLDRQGFRYLVHSFNAETCGAAWPPFHLTPQTRWFCLVYAKRVGGGVEMNAG